MHRLSHCIAEAGGICLAVLQLLAAATHLRPTPDDQLLQLQAGWLQPSVQAGEPVRVPKEFERLRAHGSEAAQVDGNGLRALRELEEALVKADEVEQGAPRLPKNPIDP